MRNPDNWLAFVVTCLVALGLSLFFATARAHDHAHPDLDKWYDTLMQPDIPMSKCCGEADAYWADGFEVQGDQYIAIITDERPDEPLGRKHIPVGTKFLVPNNKLKYDQSNPTGHGIIFVSQCAIDFVYCYLPPQAS